MQVSDRIRREAKELGMKALAKMDPLCEEHLRELEYHPLDQEFEGSAIYNEFERLVADHAENEGFDWEECDATLREEFRWEVREAFEKGYYNPSEQIQCVACLDEGEIAIRVHDPDSVSAESILDGKSRSGHVGRDDGDEWR